jgi:hypothetical protein
MGAVKGFLIKCYTYRTLWIARVSSPANAPDFIDAINDGQTTRRFAAQVAYEKPKRPLCSWQQWTVCTLEEQGYY